VGLAAAGNPGFFMPTHGNASFFDQTKVTPKIAAKSEEKELQQIGGGSEDPKTIPEIEEERHLKRKLLGENVFDLMSSPKIKTVKLNIVPPKSEKTITKQKGSGSSQSTKVHRF